MASATGPEISVPSFYTATDPKPHTVFSIVIRHPLRSLTLSKRYSDFTSLNSELEAAIGESPPYKLPPKTYLKSTVTNPDLAESRRQGLESYLRGIALCADSRWRDSPAWRQFLNLPSSATGQHAASVASHMSLTDSKSAPVTDPVLWLDLHRELKARLQDARLHLSNRDQSNSPSEILNASANAKKSLVRAAGFIEALDTGLRAMSSSSGRPSDRIGEGELRRRRDLVAVARKEKDALEALANSVSQKKAEEKWSAAADRGSNSLWSNTMDRNGGRMNTGRVLGGPVQETTRTRELDNAGVLQMQQQVLKEQDQDLEALLHAVQRQKHLGLEIGQELEIQNQMLDGLDADVERVEGKQKIASKRMKKIS